MFLNGVLIMFMSWVWVSVGGERLEVELIVFYVF